MKLKQSLVKWSPLQVLEHQNTLNEIRYIRTKFVLKKSWQDKKSCNKFTGAKYLILKLGFLYFFLPSLLFIYTFSIQTWFVNSDYGTIFHCNHKTCSQILCIADRGKPVTKELFFVPRLLRLCGVPGCSSQNILRKLSLQTSTIDRKRTTGANEVSN